MSLQVSLNLLKSFDSFMSNYEELFSNYYLNLINRLTSIEIFMNKERNYLCKLSTILVELHRFNLKLLVFFERVWKSLNYENKEIAKIQLIHLKIITRKFIKLNNKLNMMNLGASKIWEFIHFMDNQFLTHFKFNSLRYIRKILVLKFKLFKKLTRRMIIEFRMLSSPSIVDKTHVCSQEFMSILVTNQLKRLKMNEKSS